MKDARKYYESLKEDIKNINSDLFGVKAESGTKKVSKNSSIKVAKKKK